MEITSAIAWTYLTLSAAVIIDGFPMLPKLSLAVQDGHRPVINLAVLTEEYGPVTCWGWKGTDMKLCSDGVGGTFALKQDGQESRGVSHSPVYILPEYPSVDAETDRRQELVDTNLRRNLPGPNHHPRLQSALNKNGRLPYIMKRPFDSITYNHDLAGFK